MNKFLVEFKERVQISVKDLVVVFIIIYTVSPLIQQAISQYLTTYFYMAVIVVAVAYTFIVCPLDKIKEYTFLLVPFIAFEILEMLHNNNPNTLMTGYQILLFMLPICIGYYVIHQKRHLSLYTVTIFAVYIITLVTTIVGCINNPSAARTLATTATSQDATAVKYNWQNIGGFNFVYSCTLLYPLVILGFKRQKLPVAVTVLLAAAEFALAINTEYTISFMLMMFTTLLFLLPKDLSVKQFVGAALIGVVAVALFSKVIAGVMNFIGNYIGNPTMGEKMTAVFSGQEAMDSMEDRRVDRYMKSIQSFLQNPLFGTLFTTGKQGAGGHSQILDTLAQYGIVGGGLMFFMYRALFKVFYKPFVKKEGFGFVMWLFLQPIVLSTLNPGMWLQNLCMMAPITLCAIFSADDSRTPVAPPKVLRVRGKGLPEANDLTT